MRIADVGAKMEKTKFPELETERLVLRQITMDDLDFYMKHFSKREIVEGSGFPAPENEESARGELLRYIINLYNEGGGFRWGISERGQARLIGTCGFYAWDKDAKKAQIGYDLDPEFWGKGIMKEALSEMFKFGFEEMKLNRIQCLIMPENRRSIGLVRSLGFKEEGLLRENSIFEGRFRDDVAFSLLKKEWAAMHR